MSLVFSLDMLLLIFSAYLLNTSSIVDSPKWLKTKGSETALIHLPILYPCTSSSSDKLRLLPVLASQFTSETSRRSITNDPSFSTSLRTSLGLGVYCGMLNESSPICNNILCYKDRHFVSLVSSKPYALHSPSHPHDT
ncbi:hypothetical protein HanXRQr2_Chr09g0393551 [Helianthus annuus]|uniref:Uncharacterized protein n=1 Tax=Helianthus annuus TaxID=4232 RepID=A0A9K3N9G9_HELAN|nr:hypothetical protein HanXRQr2_Chr09g0393551 [Helianthus annuus]